MRLTVAGQRRLPTGFPRPRERCRLCAAGYQGGMAAQSGSSHASSAFSISSSPPREVPMALMPTLFVDDVEASSRWYQTLLGAQSVHGGPDFEMLTSRRRAGPPVAPGRSRRARRPSTARRRTARCRCVALLRSRRRAGDAPHRDRDGRGRRERSDSSSPPPATRSSSCTIPTATRSPASNAATSESSVPVVCMLAGGTGRAGPGSPVRIHDQGTAGDRSAIGDRGKPVRVRR